MARCNCRRSRGRSVRSSGTATLHGGGSVVGGALVVNVCLRRCDQSGIDVAINTVSGQSQQVVTCVG